MAETYVKMEELEHKFMEFGIPYTNIFDELESISAEEVASRMTSSDLARLIENKNDVVAVQVWKKDDVEAALSRLNIEPDKDLISEVAVKAKSGLEDRSVNWDRLHAVIKDCMMRSQGGME